MFGNGGAGFMHFGMGGRMHLFGFLTALLVFVLLVLLVIWLVKSIFFSSASSTVRMILDQRYARGEVSRKEYEQIKKDLKS